MTIGAAAIAAAVVILGSGTDPRELSGLRIWLKMISATYAFLAVTVYLVMTFILGKVLMVPAGMNEEDRDEHKRGWVTHMIGLLAGIMENHGRQATKETLVPREMEAGRLRAGHPLCPVHHRGSANDGRAAGPQHHAVLDPVRRARGDPSEQR